MHPFAFPYQSFYLKSLEQMQVSLTEICLVWTMTLFVIIVSFRNIFSEMRCLIEPILYLHNHWMVTYKILIFLCGLKMQVSCHHTTLFNIGPKWKCEWTAFIQKLQTCLNPSIAWISSCVQGATGSVDPLVYVQWNLCNPTPEFSDILWHPTKNNCPKVFLLTKLNLCILTSCTIRHNSLVPWCVGLNWFHCIMVMY
jgi:hypothetical protein